MGPATWDGHPRCLPAPAGMWQIQQVSNQVSEWLRTRGVLPAAGTRDRSTPGMHHDDHPAVRPDARTT